MSLFDQIVKAVKDRADTLNHEVWSALLFRRKRPCKYWVNQAEVYQLFGFSCRAWRRLPAHTKASLTGKARSAIAHGYIRRYEDRCGSCQMCREASVGG